MLKLNIIPSELKKQIHLENLNKKINSYFIILLTTMLFYGTALYFVSIILKKDYNDTAASANSLTRDTENYNAKTKQINSQIRQIEEIQNNTINWSEPVIKIINSVNSGISFSGISLNKNSNQIQITGRANERRDLLNFKEELNKIDFLSDINLPIETLLEKENINFSISGNIKAYELNKH